MARNQKLSSVLSKKSITAVQPQADAVAIHFSDGSVMTVQGTLATSSAAPAEDATVSGIREQGPALYLDLSTGSTLQMWMTDPGGSVIVRDANHTVRYAG